MKVRISFIFIFSLILFVSCREKSKTQTELLFYCAAGMRPPIDEIIHNYKEETGVNVSVQYGGSGTLLSNLKVSGKGDLFLSADESFIKMAADNNLIDETQTIAYLKPVIITSKGNSKKIASVRDFLRNDIVACFGIPEVTSIGRVTREIYERLGLWEEIKKDTKVFKPTVFDIANDVRLKSADAGIVWDAVANQYPEIESIQDSLLNNYKENVTVALLKSSSSQTAALRFLRYMTAKDKGLSIFSKYNYNVPDGDKWSRDPELLIYIGAVNRVAVDSIITRFEQREGIKITRVYNGCGILVGQIKSGQQPDVFLTCDSSYMNKVLSGFNDIENISQTEIIIATKPGNPLNINSLIDLNTKTMKVGVCNPEQSTLGDLTQSLFKELKLEGINRNVVVQTPTADLLINQLLTGALDAAIVYRANTVHVKNKIDVIQIGEKDALAIQNIGLAKNSENRNLMKRLIAAIKSEDSKKSYTENGFTVKE